MTGTEAHGTTETDLTLLPYRQSYDHDAFGYTTDRSSTLWNNGGSWDFSNTMTNNRASSGTYDDEGQQTSGEDINFDYDGAKAMRRTWRDFRYETLLYADGVGHEAKRSQRAWDAPDDEEGDWEDWKTRYFIYSSVLGQNVTEASETGKKRRTYVIASGSAIARQGIDEGSTTETVGWEHRDPSGLSTRTIGGGPEAFATSELDALGNNVGILAVLSPVINRPGMSGGDNPNFTDVQSGSVSQAGVLKPGTFAHSLAVTDNRGVPWIYAAPDPSHELPGGGYMATIIDPNRPYGFAADGGRPYYSAVLATVGVTVNYGLNGASAAVDQNDCEKWLAKTLTGVSDTIFSDVTDEDGTDPFTGLDDGYEVPLKNLGYVVTHSHGYNPQNEALRHTKIYAPPGGTVLGGLEFDTGQQSVVNIFYPKFGNQTNIVLQIFHVEDFTGGIRQADGSLLLGTFGENGHYRYPGNKAGYHFHVNAWKWWGKLKKGKPVLKKGNVGFPSKSFRTVKNMGFLSNLCPK